MQLSRPGFFRLFQTIIDTFSSEGSLIPLARLAFGKNIDQIAAGGNLEERIFAMITYAEDHDEIGTLIQVAHGMRRNHTGLSVIAEEYTRTGQISMAETSIGVHPGDQLPANNLPQILTQLVDRDIEAKTIAEILRKEQVRLVTLLGAGGIGKTRLSIRVGEKLTDEYQDRVYFVPLATARNADQVATAIANRIGRKASSNDELIRVFQVDLRHTPVLLLLENFENVKEARSLIAELLRESRKLKILVTSREPLDISGEERWVVPPLKAPSKLPPALTVHELSQYDAVTLFRDRAKDIQSSFTIDDANAPAIAEICARLEGVPLAIELAAAWIKIESPEELLAKLNERLLDPPVPISPLDQEERHRTLRATIDWSYTRLDQHEQQLFTRLAIFAGGCTREAAVKICNLEVTPEVQVRYALNSLTQKNLLYETHNSRYHLPEMIHTYAREKLEREGELATVAQRHAIFFLEMVERSEPLLSGLQQQQVLKDLEIEQVNIEAALEWSLEQELGEIALRIASAQWYFWHLRGDAPMRKGLALLERALAVASVDLSHRIHTLRNASFLALDLHHVEKAEHFGKQNLQLARRVGDQPAEAFALMILGQAASLRGSQQQANKLFKESIALFRAHKDDLGLPWALDWYTALLLEQGKDRKAEKLIEESLQIRIRSGDKQGEMWAYRHIGKLWEYRGDYVRASEFHEKSMRIAQGMDRPVFTARALGNLMNVAWKQRDDKHALEFGQESLRIFRRLGDTQGSAWLLHHLGDILLAQQQYDQALDYYREGLILFRTLIPFGSHQTINDQAIADCITGIAHIARLQNQIKWGARLIGWVEKLRGTLPIEWAELNPQVKAVGSLSEDTVLGKELAQGREMSLEYVIAYTLREVQ